MFRRSLIPFVALALLGVGTNAQTQTAFFPNDTTINYAVPVDALVGYTNQDDFDVSRNPSSPTVNLIEGGSIYNYLSVRNSSTVNMSEGSINGNLYTFESSIVNISGGIVASKTFAFGSSIINWSGGSINTVNVNEILLLRESSVLNVFGRGLVAILIDSSSNDSRYSLSGTLLDGTILMNKKFDISIGMGARFNLINAVPAPGSLFTALIGMVPGVLLLRRRRK